MLIAVKMILNLINTMQGFVSCIANLNFASLAAGQSTGPWIILRSYLGSFYIPSKTLSYVYFNSLLLVFCLFVSGLYAAAKK